MNAIDFPEANRRFEKPPDWDESQCLQVPGYVGQVEGGTLDGCPIVVTACVPTEAELELIKAGKPIFITFCGVLPPHYLSMDFHAATHPA